MDDSDHLSKVLVRSYIRRKLQELLSIPPDEVRRDLRAVHPQVFLESEATADGYN